MDIIRIIGGIGCGGRLIVDLYILKRLEDGRKFWRNHVDLNHPLLEGIIETWDDVIKKAKILSMDIGYPYVLKPIERSLFESVHAGYFFEEGDLDETFEETGISQTNQPS